MASAFIIRKLRGHRLRLAHLGWGLLMVATGAAIARRQQHLGRATAKAAANERSARFAAAELAGANDLAVTTDSIVDRLQRATALLEPGLRGSATRTNGGDGHRSSSRRLTAEWKADLARRTRGEANYLVDALLGWQKRHNLHPDLSTVVRFDLTEVDPGLVIDHAQRRQLETCLEEWALRGRLTVRLTEQRSGLRLAIDDQELALPRSAGTVTTADPAPSGLLSGALVPLAALAPATGGCPPWAVLPGPILALAIARWAERRLRDEGPAARVAVAWASAGLASGTALLMAGRARSPLGEDCTVLSPRC